MHAPKWLHALETLGPLVLATTPLAPLAPIVVAAIRAAESIPGATGEQKQQAAKNIINIWVQAANAIAGKALLDPVLADQTAGAAIDAVVGVANLAHGVAQ